MKRSKLTESQIVAMLNEGQAGVKVEDICRQYGIAKSSYYKLRSKYQGMGVSDLQRLKELEDENRRLKQMYADIILEHKVLKDIVEKKL
ncbi:Transposase [Piscirickettsia salmonis]|uniref:transposase n=1 Tax=Piscirickettsia salmonis TaxID=1238 RepID=UPI0012B77A47|nr:transposase [Piscirickettsia salmonis]QGP51145.1 Transposase [Piscirickettsia salmonis]